MSRKISAVVLGASGYVGGELLRLIAGHPAFELAAAVSDSCAERGIGENFGHLAQSYAGVRFVAHANWLDTVEAGDSLALFSAAPHGASAAVIANALDATSDKGINVHVVDSSADFRYARQDDYEAVYKTPHGAPQLLDQFACAVPEHLEDNSAAHVGHPGCFATATLLAAVPLIRSGLTDAELFVSGVTGSTGSGKSPQPGTHHPERNSNLYAYKPLAHRHAPEMSGLAKANQAVSEAALHEVFANAYGTSPFVEIVSGTPRLKNVVASNMCHISVASDGDSVVVMSAIDNLVKGAAGGAVQWMNRLWNLPETTGLLAPAPGWT